MLSGKSRLLAIFVMTCTVCMAIVIPSILNLLETEKINVKNLSIAGAAKITTALNTPINQLYTVSTFIQQSNGDLSKLDELANSIVTRAHIRNLIIAPDGVVTHVYPDTEDNRNVIGLDYYSDSSEGNREAIIAAQSHQLLLAGPFTTVVGDQAISGRLPVFLTNEEGRESFWGLLSITLYYPEVLEGTFTELFQNIPRTAYELWRNNPDTGAHQVLLSNGIIDADNDYIDESLELLNTEWFLRIANVKRWYHYNETWIYTLVSICIAALMTITTKKNQELRIVQKQLEGLAHYDTLTCILNRHGLFIRLNEIIDEQTTFQVNYLDLDRFKEINDQYGHSVGDQVLAEFARRVCNHLNEKHIFARIGGDEFIIIYIAKEFNTTETNTFWEIIYDEFSTPIATINGNDILLKFSRGSAIYPTDSNSLDSILFKADAKMYQQKRSNRKAHTNP